MLSIDKKHEITERITTSNIFKNAPASVAILRYLVQANIEDRFLKEGIIDMEFFGTKPDVDKSNPRVRVSVYHLRNRLKTYYAEDGREELWRIKIDKGQYSLRFEKHNVKTQLPSKSQISFYLPYILCFITLVILWISHFPKQQPALWEEFFDNGHSTNLFIGDAFGFRGTTVSKSQGWTRDFSINNIEQFYNMLEENPDLKDRVTPTDLFYSTRMAENSTYDLAKFFTKGGHDFDIHYASQSTFSDIKKSNVIYVGRYLNQNNFVFLFNKSNPYVSINEKNIEIKNCPSIADTIFATPKTNIDVDYTVVLRSAGTNNTEQFMFFSNHDIGVMATVEYFTNADSLSAFSEKYLSKDPYFTAIFIAKGKERTSLDLETVVVLPFKQ